MNTHEWTLMLQGMTAGVNFSTIAFLLFARRHERSATTTAPSLTWTRTVPTVPGWYWVRSENEPPSVHLVEINQGWALFKTGGIFAARAGSDVPCCTYLFAGPIAPPA